MSGNNEQKHVKKGLQDSLQELQILRFFTTLAILTIIFVLVLRFVQQTSITSDKNKPIESSLGTTSIETMLEFAPRKTHNNLNQSVVDQKKIETN